MRKFYQDRNRFLLISAFVLSLLINPAFAQAPTNEQDRDQMLKQLGLSLPALPSKLNDPNRPANAWPSDKSNPEGNWTDSAGHIITRSGYGLWNNYSDKYYGLYPGPDSSRLGNYTPIDLLKMKDGRIIKTAEQWWNSRRPEILRDVQEQVWGIIPPDSILPKVIWSVTTSNGGSGDTAYIQKIILGTIDISRYPEVRNRPQISATLRIPANAAKPVPVMIVIGHNFWTPIDRYWKICSPNGWGVCIFDCTLLQPDNGAGLTSYLIGLCNKGNWRKPADWGSIGAWSWGVSKLTDYLQRDKDIDASKIGVTGHSRWGKTALAAMAYEPRLAIAFPSCGGSLGTKMNRRHWGQDLENSGWEQEYHWVAGNFFKWMGELNPGKYMPRKIEDCPVDAHSLLSLCAPKPVFLNAGTQDTWTDPYGIYLAGAGATPIYELLGKQGLIIQDRIPKIDTSYISGSIGYKFHNGGHIDTPDWPAFFDFAKKALKEDE